MLAQEVHMQVYIGIDWSEEKHAVIFMNQAGADLASLTIEHSLDGFVTFDLARQKLGLEPADCWIGLETAHTLLIDYLWSQTYTQVYVLAPNQVKSNQGRFRQSQAKDDPQDARLIADILRTDRSRLQPWCPDRLLTRQMRAKVSLIMHLTKQTTRLSNRLRSVLLRYYPAALQVFKGGLTTQIAPEFVSAYPTPQAAHALSYAEFVNFARSHGYRQTQNLPGNYARLQASYPPASPETVLVYQHEAQLLAGLLVENLRAKARQLAELQKLYRQHPNYAIFASLPGAAKLIGPGQLVKFGDDRQRFPHPSSVQALAGTCPVTRRSGKHKSVLFRRACDKEWRYLCQAWARALVYHAKSPIACAYFEQIRPHCHSEQHAFRCVANRWLAVAWKLWQSGQTYDEAYHFQQRALRSKPRP
jgi:transposase